MKIFNRISSLMLFVLLMVISVRAGAVTYYVCDNQAGADAGCVPGDDSNNGTSPVTPWRTVDKALNTIQYNTPAGTTVLFARGGSFMRQQRYLRMADFSSTKDNPIVFDAYTPSTWVSSSKLPIIFSTYSITLFDFQDGGEADRDEGYVVRNLDLEGGGQASCGINMFNDVDYITMENLVINGCGTGLGIGSANAVHNPGADGSNDNWILRNSTITNNLGMGFLGSGSDFIIENNLFDNNGFDGAMLNHNIYVGSHDLSSNSVIRNNILKHSAMDGGIASGVSLVVHGQTSGLIIENNTIQEDIGAVAGGCYGIAVDPGGYGIPESFPGTIIRGNRIINVGNIAIAATSCPDIIIENNIIIQEQPAISFYGIKVPNQIRGGSDAPDNHATIRNNSIYISTSVANTCGIYLGVEGTNHVVVSNAIHYLGSGAPANGGWSCFDTTGLTAPSFAAFDNNVCDFPNVTPPNGRWEKTAGSLASWRIATGFDTNSQQADPKFISPGFPSYNLIIQQNSPCINSGNSTLSSLSDITGHLKGSMPDVGAYEFIDSGKTPSAPRGLRFH
jgi:hypothetical protein